MTCEPPKSKRLYFAKVLRTDGKIVHWTNNGKGASLDQLAAEAAEAMVSTRAATIWVLDLDGLCVWKPAHLVESRQATLEVY